jgi:hypothetical protein
MLLRQHSGPATGPWHDEATLARLRQLLRPQETLLRAVPIDRCTDDGGPRPCFAPARHSRRGVQQQQQAGGGESHESLAISSSGLELVGLVSTAATTNGAAGDGGGSCAVLRFVCLPSQGCAWFVACAAPLCASTVVRVRNIATSYLPSPSRGEVSERLS